MASFQGWLLIWKQVDGHGLLRSEARWVDNWLAAYAQSLFQKGSPWGDLAETINAMVDIRPELRHRLPTAWECARRWKLQIPASSHVPTPHVVMQALTTLAYYWDGAICLCSSSSGSSACFGFLRL